MKTKIKTDDRVLEFNFKDGSARLTPLNEGWHFDLMELEDGWLKEIKTDEWLKTNKKDPWRDFRHILHVHNKENVHMLFLEVQEWNGKSKCGEFETTILEPLVVLITNQDHCQVTILNPDDFEYNW